MKSNTRFAVAAAVLAFGSLTASCAAVTAPFASRDALVATPDPCADRRFEIYFAEGRAELTAAARSAIDLTADQLQSCEVRHVRVLGLADATGEPRANLTLSERRADVVAEALAAAGWPAPAFELEAGGADGAVTASGASEPLRRRTEVVVHARPR